MTESQAETIINLLEKMLEKLEIIETNTSEIGYIAGYTNEMKETMDRIRRRL